MKPPQRRRGRAAGLEERTTTLRNRGGLEAKGWSLWSWGERAGKGLDNKIQSLAIKYKHAVPTVEKGRRGGIREDRLSWGGAVGSYPTLPCTPPIQTPSLCVCGCVCVGRVHTSPSPSRPPPTLNCCHSSCCRLSFGCHSSAHRLRRGKERGGVGNSPQPAWPHPPPPPLPEVPAVVRVGVTVFCDNHSVGELAACQALHGFLAVKHRGELHEDLPAARHLDAIHRPGDLDGLD